MNGKIDKDGNLHIQRNSDYKRQYCMIAGVRSDGIVVGCCDVCPLFGEPEQPHKDSLTELELCHKTLSFDEFKDERQ